MGMGATTMTRTDGRIERIVSSKRSVKSKPPRQVAPAQGPNESSEHAASADIVGRTLHGATQNETEYRRQTSPMLSAVWAPVTEISKFVNSWPKPKKGTRYRDPGSQARQSSKNRQRTCQRTDRSRFNGQADVIAGASRPGTVPHTSCHPCPVMCCTEPCSARFRGIAPRRRRRAPGRRRICRGDLHASFVPVLSWRYSVRIPNFRCSDAYPARPYSPRRETLSHVEYMRG